MRQSALDIQIRTSVAMAYSPALATIYNSQISPLAALTAAGDQNIKSVLSPALAVAAKAAWPNVYTTRPTALLTAGAGVHIAKLNDAGTAFVPTTANLVGAELVQGYAAKVMASEGNYLNDMTNVILGAFQDPILRAAVSGYVDETALVPIPTKTLASVGGRSVESQITAVDVTTTDNFPYVQRLQANLNAINLPGCSGFLATVQNPVPSPYNYGMLNDMRNDWYESGLSGAMVWSIGSALTHLNISVDPQVLGNSANAQTDLYIIVTLPLTAVKGIPDQSFTSGGYSVAANGDYGAWGSDIGLYRIYVIPLTRMKTNSAPYAAGEEIPITTGVAGEVALTRRVVSDSLGNQVPVGIRGHVTVSNGVRSTLPLIAPTSPTTNIATLIGPKPFVL